MKDDALVDYATQFYYYAKEHRKVRNRSRFVVAAICVLGVISVTIPFVQSYLKGDVHFILVAVLAFVWISMMGLLSYQLVATADIALDSEGVRLFWNKKACHFVPWNNFTNAEFITISTAGIYLGTQPDITNNVASVGVVVRGLSVIHFFNAIANGYPRSYFIISSRHDQFPDLLHRLERESKNKLIR